TLLQTVEKLSNLPSEMRNRLADRVICEAPGQNKKNSKGFIELYLSYADADSASAPGVELDIYLSNVKSLINLCSWILSASDKYFSLAWRLLSNLAPYLNKTTYTARVAWQFARYYNRCYRLEQEPIRKEAILQE